VRAALARLQDQPPVMRQAPSRPSTITPTASSLRDQHVAIGILMERLRLDYDGAVGALRAQARTEGRSVDELAAHMVDAANRLRHDRPARHVLKGARWLLLRNRCNLRSRAERVRLRDLLAANRPLLTVYVLKDDLKQLWAYRYPAAAERFFRHWYRRAISSRLAPLKKFARALKRLLPGILAHCRWPLHTSLLEGINNKIKVLKRMAYGFRDDAYFFLKIRAAFPGLP